MKQPTIEELRAEIKALEQVLESKESNPLNDLKDRALATYDPKVIGRVPFRYQDEESRALKIEAYILGIYSKTGKVPSRRDIAKHIGEDIEVLRSWMSNKKILANGEKVSPSIKWFLERADASKPRMEAPEPEAVPAVYVKPEVQQAEIKALVQEASKAFEDRIEAVVRDRFNLEGTKPETKQMTPKAQEVVIQQAHKDGTLPKPQRKVIVPNHALLCAEHLEKALSMGISSGHWTQGKGMAKKVERFARTMREKGGASPQPSK